MAGMLSSRGIALRLVRSVNDTLEVWSNILNRKGVPQSFSAKALSLLRDL